MNGWQNFGRIHTVPLDDMAEHSLCADCACGPKVEYPEDSQVQHVIHNAFDGRDFDENERARVKPLRVLGA